MFWWSECLIIHDGASWKTVCMFVCLDLKDSSDSKSITPPCRTPFLKVFWCLLKSFYTQACLIIFHLVNYSIIALKKLWIDITGFERPVCVLCIQWTRVSKKISNKSGKNLFYWQHAKYSPGFGSKQAYIHTRSKQREEGKKEMCKRKWEMCLRQHQKHTSTISKYLKWLRLG